MGRTTPSKPKLAIIVYADQKLYMASTVRLDMPGNTPLLEAIRRRHKNYKYEFEWLDIPFVPGQHPADLRKVLARLVSECHPSLRDVLPYNIGANVDRFITVETIYHLCDVLRQKFECRLLEIN